MEDLSGNNLPNIQTTQKNNYFSDTFPLEAENMKITSTRNMEYEGIETENM